MGVAIKKFAATALGPELLLTQAAVSWPEDLKAESTAGEVECMALGVALLAKQMAVLWPLRTELNR